MRKYLFYVFFRAVAFLTAWLPIKATWPVFEFLAKRAAGRSSQVATVRKNMARAADLNMTDPKLDDIVEKAFLSYALYWHELFRLPRTPAADIPARVQVDGKSYLDDAVSDGKGVLVAMPHVGNWELGGAWLATEGHQISVVAERLEPPALYKWFKRVRDNVGMLGIPLDSSAGAAVTAALAQKRVIGLLADRDIEGNGVTVDFLGEKTTMPGGTALLALRTGAPIVPTVVYMNKDRTLHVNFTEPMRLERNEGLRKDTEKATQLLADRLAAFVRVAPEQWHVFQPNWPDDKS